jgi:hypothetical protein
MSHFGPSKRVDELARRLAGGREPVCSSAIHDGAGDAGIERLARMLATPVSRRRAVALIGGAAAAGSLLRPRAAGAQNCFPGGPKICTAPHGQRVCVPDDYQCCSNDYCAVACHPDKACEGAGICGDTSAMCLDKTTGRRMRFCSKYAASQPTTCHPNGYSSTRGWCCDPSLDCGPEIGDCVCPPERECDGDCCGVAEECVELRGGGRVCMERCPDHRVREGTTCVCREGTECGPGCCAPNRECVRGLCVMAKKSSKLKDLWDSFTDFGDTGAQTAGAGARHAGPQSLSAAQAGDAVGAALIALAAVNAQGVVAGKGYSGDRVDRAYRRRVRAPRISPPRIASGPGLDQVSARALQSLLSAEAKGFGLALAAGTALARARGALARDDLRAARRQVLAAARFSADAARLLRRVPALRANAVGALRRGGTTEVVATDADVRSMQAAVRAGGVPASVRSALRRLGVRGGDLKPVRATLLATQAGGPVLIAPLADPARTANMKALSAELSRYARAARRAPISRSRPEPRRVGG